jgi:hypothetical protein
MSSHKNILYQSRKPFPNCGHRNMPQGSYIKSVTAVGPVDRQSFNPTFLFRVEKRGRRRSQVINELRVYSIKDNAQLLEHLAFRALPSVPFQRLH